MSVTSGNYPVYNNVFKISKSGKSSQPTDMVTVADINSFSVSVNNNIEEWTPMDTEGWVKRLLTGKSMTVTLSGKRCVGDAGNDYLAGLALKSGADAETKFEWTFGDGTKVAFDCIVNVTGMGGDSTTGEPLECEILTNGKPTVTAAV